MADEPTPTNCTWALAAETSPTIAVSTTTAKNAFVPLISIFSLELGLVISSASWSVACRSDPPWRPVEFLPSQDACRSSSVPRHSLHHQNSAREREFPWFECERTITQGC